MSIASIVLLLLRVAKTLLDRAGDAQRQRVAEDRVYTELRRDLDARVKDALEARRKSDRDADAGGLRDDDGFRRD